MLSKLTFLWTLISIGIFIFGSDSFPKKEYPAVIEINCRPDTKVALVVANDSLAGWLDIPADGCFLKIILPRDSGKSEIDLSEESNINNFYLIKP